MGHIRTNFRDDGNGTIAVGTGDSAQKGDIPLVFLNHDANTGVPDSFGILGIILVPFYVLYPFRIGNDDTDIPFLQNVENRAPILPGRFHADIQAVVLMEPIGKAVQVRIERRKAFLLIARLQAVCRGLNDGSHQK